MRLIWLAIGTYRITRPGYLGRLTDQQLRDGLSASGASEEDADSFAASLRERIEQLRRAGSETRQP